MINLIPFLVTLFSPYVAIVMGNIGCFIGLFMVYIIPTLTYWKMLRNDIELCKIERPQTVTLFEVLDDFQNYNSELR